MGGGTLIPLPCPCLQLTNKIVFVVSFVGNRGTFIRGYKAMVMDMEFLYHVGYILTSVLGLFVHELFYSILVSLLGAGTGRGVGVIGAPLKLLEEPVGNQWEQRSPGIQRHLRSHRPRSHGPVPARQLFDLIYREETLFNVIKSVTRNGRSILLTALLALILVYLFSIVGFLFLKDDFILEVDRLPGNHSGGLTAPLLGGGGSLGGVVHK